MKTIKTIFAILFLSSMFIACEAEATEDQLGLEEAELVASEDAGADFEGEPGW